ncbi:hypothetical protein HS088_TW11G00556 [Tripterygium wilfordii]|uniref:Chloroplast J-like domain 1 n=1 Tax=Tripterygium wilfordii TaxID=458696 RepID=A0A7J7D2B1_TRIWF|nr:hypothetical protein HS088_TW11G00556 [Tripterygium wilfordii]
MASAVSNVFLSPNPQIPRRSINLAAAHHVTLSPSSFVRFSRTFEWKRRVICASASAAGSSNPNSDLNPYEVLGVSPISGFDAIKAAYTKKHKEAEQSGDESTAAQGIGLGDIIIFNYDVFLLGEVWVFLFQLERAYDKVMMAQLTNRKKGVTFGQFKVSKDIKYADKQPIVPWGPRFTKSSKQDMLINLAISAVFTVWIVVKRNVEYKPLQFLAFAFVYRIFEKLKSFEAPVSTTYTEEGEDDGRALRMGKRLLRSLALVFGCIAFSSVAYTCILNLIEYAGSYIPSFLYNNQEMLVTSSSAVMLYIMASYYR